MVEKTVERSVRIGFGTTPRDAIARRIALAGKNNAIPLWRLFLESIGPQDFVTRASSAIETDSEGLGSIRR